MQNSRHRTLSFDSFTLDLTRGCLLQHGQDEIRLRPKSFEVLRYLVEHSGRLVSKRELIAAIWADTAVTDDSLVQCLIEVRRALGDGGQRMVRTVPRRGYVFEPEVVEQDFVGQETIAATQAEGVSVDLCGEAMEKQAASHNQLLLQAARRNVPRSGIAVAVLILAALGTAIIGAAYFAVPRYILRSNAPLSPSSGAAAIRSIAVLPLENLSGDPAQDYLVDGMTEALINNLGQIRALRVISRTSAMRYKGSHKSLPEIAGELNADAVIEGSVQRFGERVQVTAQLIRAATDAHIWAGKYERDLTEVLRLQSEIAGAIADEIRIHITAEEKVRLAAVRSVNSDAHMMYLLGRYHFNKANQEGWKQAVEYFTRAIQIAPDYAAAYAGRSKVWQQKGGFGAADFKETELLAREAALKAIELDEELAEGHVALANIKVLYDWDWTAAEHEFRRALELDPGSLDAHTYYGHLLSFVGRHDEAIREGEIAVQLDPVSSGTRASLGWFSYRARRYQEALEHLQRAFELEPRSVVVNGRLGLVYVEIGRYDEAIAAFHRIRELTPTDKDFVQTAIARIYALMGRQREARTIIRGLNTDSSGLAAVYAALGDNDQAFKILKNAIKKRSESLAGLKGYPPLDILGSDPRWNEFLRLMNFSPE